MSCDRWSAHLSAFLDRELSPDDGRAVEAHLASCGSCRDELIALREVGAALAVPVDPDPRFVTRFRARRDESVAAARWQWWRQVAVRLLPLAAAALLGAGTLWWIESGRGEALDDLEAREIGSGIPLQDTSYEADDVLRIALEPFPGGIR